MFKQLARSVFLAASVVVGLMPPASSAVAQSPYTEWPNGPSTDPSYFPIGIWNTYITPERVPLWQALGINTFVGQQEQVTLQNVYDVANAGMALSCLQDPLLMDHLAEPAFGAVNAWSHMDEPDNAQPVAGGWGPCVPPSVIIQRYYEMKAQDPTRPVYLNLGQGVCWPYTQQYYGRGLGASWEQYPEFCKGADIISFDVYPCNAPNGEPPADKPYYVAIGVDRLRQWTGGQKPIWVCIETGDITPNDGNPGPTPQQTKAQTWLALIHGATGVTYFGHSWTVYPGQSGYLLLEPAAQTMRDALSIQNAQIRNLAPVLNTSTTASYLNLSTATVNWMQKDVDGAVYVFAAATQAKSKLSYTFSLSGLPAS
jgi:hypothetical protein